MTDKLENKKPSLPTPSPRMTAALAAAMLALGVAVGAAIGPAPSASFAGAARLPLLLPSLLAGAGASERPSTTAVQPPPIVPQATPRRKARVRKAAASAQTPTSTATAPTSTSETTAPPTTTPTGKAKVSPLPPVTKVWLIELAGTTFAEATAQPSAAPYIDTQAVPSGTLLSGYSALDGSALASETALLATGGPALIDTIIQPPCPEGAAAAQCASGTPGGLSAADEFLKATLPTIVASAPYRENGLIVVTFGAVASATATGLPAGAATATLTSQPPAGVLVISPFATAGSHSATAFDPTSPRRSLEKLLHH
jgi:hypothetical protein